MPSVFYTKGAALGNGSDSFAVYDYMDVGTVMLNMVRTLRMTVAVARQRVRRACMRLSSSPFTRQAL